MLSDDQMLDRIRPRAAQIQRRDRLRVTAAAALMVMAVLGVTVAAVSDDRGGDESQDVLTDDDRRPTTTAATTTTTDVADDRASSTTTGPTTSTTTTVAPTTTDPSGATPPPEGPTPSTGDDGGAAPSTTTTAPPVSATTPAPPSVAHDSVTVDGLTLDVTVTYPSQTAAGPATATVTLTTAHGSAPGASITFDSELRDPPQYAGSGPNLRCLEAPSTGPDPAAGPVDTTFTFTYEYSEPYQATRRAVNVGAWTSLCTDDQAIATLELIFPIP